MTEKRFRKGKSILTDFPTGAIIDEETGERYYDGIKPSYISSKELVKILNEFNEENSKLHIQNDFLKDENRHMRDLVNENQQLKDEVKEYKEAMKRMMIDMMGGQE